MFFLIAYKTDLILIHKSMDHQFLGRLLWASYSSWVSGAYVFLLTVQVSWK